MFPDVLWPTIMDYVCRSECKDSITWKSLLIVVPQARNEVLRRWRPCYRDHPLTTCCFVHDEFPKQYLMKLDSLHAKHHVCIGPENYIFSHSPHRKEPSPRLKLFVDWVKKNARDPSILDQYIYCCNGYGLTHIDSKHGFFFYGDTQSHNNN